MTHPDAHPQVHWRKGSHMTNVQEEGGGGGGGDGRWNEGGREEGKEREGLKNTGQ